MYWDTFAKPVPLEELGWVNTVYLGTGTSVWDPMIVWGTTVETEPLEKFLVECRQSHGLMLSPAHVLVNAVAQSLKQHPKMNRRVIWNRVYQYKTVNVIMPMMQTRAGEVDSVFLRGADELSLAEISQRFWSEARDKAVRVAEAEKTRQSAGLLRRALGAVGRRIHLRSLHTMAWMAFVIANRWRVPTVLMAQQELNGGNAFVNYLGFRGAPPLISFKPSCLPMNSYSVNVTLGASEPRPVVIDGDIVIRRQAPLYIRFDHRMVNIYEAAAFINTLRSYLAEPWKMAQYEKPPMRNAA